MYEEILNKLKDENVQFKSIKYVKKTINKSSPVKLDNILRITDDNIIDINKLNQLDRHIKRQLPSIIYIQKNKKVSKTKNVVQPKKKIKREFNIRKFPAIKIDMKKTVEKQNEKTTDNIWL